MIKLPGISAFAAVLVEVNLPAAAQIAGSCAPIDSTFFGVFANVDPSRPASTSLDQTLRWTSPSSTTATTVTVVAADMDRATPELMPACPYPLISETTRFVGLPSTIYFLVAEADGLRQTQPVAVVR